MSTAVATAQETLLSLKLAALDVLGLDPLGAPVSIVHADDLLRRAIRDAERLANDTRFMAAAWPLAASAIRAFVRERPRFDEWAPIVAAFLPTIRRDLDTAHAVLKK